MVPFLQRKASPESLKHEPFLGPAPISPELTLPGPIQDIGKRNSADSWTRDLTPATQAKDLLPSCLAHTLHVAATTLPQLVSTYYVPTLLQMTQGKTHRSQTQASRAVRGGAELCA